MIYNLTECINNSIQNIESDIYNEEMISSIYKFIITNSDYSVNWDKDWANWMWVYKNEEFIFMVWTLFPLIISKDKHTIIDDLRNEFIDFECYYILDNPNMLSWKFCVDIEDIQRNKRWKWDSSVPNKCFEYENFKLVM